MDNTQKIRLTRLLEREIRRGSNTLATVQTRAVLFKSNGIEEEYHGDAEAIFEDARGRLLPTVAGLTSSFGAIPQIRTEREGSEASTECYAATSGDYNQALSRLASGNFASAFSPSASTRQTLSTSTNPTSALSPPASTRGTAPTSTSPTSLFSPSASTRGTSPPSTSPTSVMSPSASSRGTAPTSINPTSVVSSASTRQTGSAPSHQPSARQNATALAPTKAPPSTVSFPVRKFRKIETLLSFARSELPLDVQSEIENWTPKNYGLEALIDEIFARVISHKDSIIERQNRLNQLHVSNNQLTAQVQGLNAQLGAQAKGDATKMNAMANRAEYAEYRFQEVSVELAKSYQALHAVEQLPHNVESLSNPIHGLDEAVFDRVRGMPDGDFAHEFRDQIDRVIPDRIQAVRHSRAHSGRITRQHTSKCGNSSCQVPRCLQNRNRRQKSAARLKKEVTSTLNGSYWQLRPRH